MPNPTFSLVHCTARPWGFQAAFSEYFHKAKDWSRVEYIACYDAAQASEFRYQRENKSIRWIEHPGERCYVAAANYAAQQAWGHVILMVTDDMMPPSGWQEKIEKHFTTEEPRILWVNDGVFPHIMTMQIFNQAWLKREGCVFRPKYRSMNGDRDLTFRAMESGCMIDLREDPEMQWKHYHHRNGGRPLDSYDQVNQSAERYAEGFRNMQEDWPTRFPQGPMIDVLYDEIPFANDESRKAAAEVKQRMEGKVVAEVNAGAGQWTRVLLAGRPRKFYIVGKPETVDPQYVAAAMLAGIPFEFATETPTDAEVVFDNGRLLERELCLKP